LYKGDWLTPAEKAAVIAEEKATDSERTALDAAVEAAKGKKGEEKEAALQVINERKEALAAKLRARQNKAATDAAEAAATAASLKASAKAEGKKVKQAEKLAERNKYAEKRKADALEEKNRALAAAKAARAAKAAKTVTEAQPTPLAPVN